MRVVVTGGAGFVGANLCRALVGSDVVTDVIAFDNLSTGSKTNLDGVPITLIEADLLDLDAVRGAIRGAASIVHLGARPSVPKSLDDPLASHHANATGTVHVLEAARLESVPHVIVASSSSVYGANPTLPKSEGVVTAPMSPYAASKLATEGYACAYATSFGLETLTFRFFNIFGRLQPAGHAYAAVVPAFLDAALNGRPLPLYGDGEQSRDFTHVSTVAAVLVKAVIDRVSDPHPVNLAFGSRVSLRELISLLEQLLERPLEVEQMPARTGDVRHSQADGNRLAALFPSISPVPLSVALRDTIAWFREQTP